jgi:hypothetical protein
MNICDLWNRGAAMAPKPPQHKPAVVRAAEASRKQWLRALQADQVRAWLDLGAEQREVLNGLATVLALAAFIQAHDLRTEDTPDQRVIRGALSAAAQCAEAGAVITVADARAFSSACDRAVAIIQAGSVSAIIAAAVRVRAAAGVV